MKTPPPLLCAVWLSRLAVILGLFATPFLRAEPAVPAATLEGGGNRTIDDLGLTLIWIAPGSFSMGSASAGTDRERPVTQVTLTRGFWLGRTEVTQAQWTALMESNPSHFKGDSLPVELVNWNEVMEFCQKLTERERAAGRLSADLAYTLPTEAQWEYACRAGTTSDTSPANLDELAWHMANSGEQTHPVGQKQANPWGLYDMYGNVWEWCLDWYGDYAGGSVADPRGVPAGPGRIIRGGSWRGSAVDCRAPYRSAKEWDHRRHGLGLRLALSAVR